ncbi:carotenoid ester lipase precursor [Obba rivulosa]|uniref:Carboxylic ester hydrolase n=1 Tax=Obba rivulosa TaxID=1052685 RepID=A0A8E2B153_9APHY|nr:carotenoid ester lipase precursor [Obba rivulosa]
MRSFLNRLAFFILYWEAVLSVPSPRTAAPTVVLDQGTFTGVTDGTSNKFLGIPFAQPPVGDLRFQLPVPNDPYNGTFDATAFGGFQRGSSSTYDGSGIVKRSVELDEPIVYVSMDYRMSAYGFLASQEVKDAGLGNFGLWDQRQALQWIQMYISAFGGDPSKVTLWGESAGAISVAMQLLANAGDPAGLFRAAVMESGSPIPVGDITHGQEYYDALLSETGCTGSADTLECLRQLPFDTLKAAVDQSPDIFSPQSLNLAWLPRVDGIFLTDAPQQLMLQGNVAAVPIISGDCDDEGTLFTLSLLNITDQEELEDYISSNYFPTVPDTVDVLTPLLEAYPDDVADGSPFRTGQANALTPEFKRLATIQGDLVFQAPRRFFLQQQSGIQAHSVSKRLKDIPILGSFHGSDLLNFYGPYDARDYLINFVNNLDPNGQDLLSWPPYSTASPSLLTMLDGNGTSLNITEDTYRADGINLLTNLSLQFPL